MVNYFDKYLKYKNKYLNLNKNTIITSKNKQKYIKGGGRMINIINKLSSDNILGYQLNLENLTTIGDLQKCIFAELKKKNEILLIHWTCIGIFKDNEDLNVLTYEQLLNDLTIKDDNNIYIVVNQPHEHVDKSINDYIEKIERRELSNNKRFFYFYNYFINEFDETYNEIINSTVKDNCILNYVPYLIYFMDTFASINRTRNPLPNYRPVFEPVPNVEFDYGELEYGEEWQSWWDDDILKYDKVYNIFREILTQETRQNQSVVICFMKILNYYLNYDYEKMSAFFLLLDSQFDNEVFYIELSKNKIYILDYVTIYKNDLINDNFIRKILVNNGKEIKYANEKSKKDREIAEIILSDEYNSSMLNCFHFDIIKDVQFIYDIAKEKNNKLYNYIDINNFYKKNKEYAKDALKYNSDLIKLADINITNDRDIAILCINENPHTLRYFDKYNKDKEIVTMAIIKDYTTFQYASEEIKKDKEFVLDAIRNEYKIVKFASSILKKKADFANAALEINRDTLEYLSEYSSSIYKNVLNNVALSDQPTYEMIKFHTNDKWIMLLALNKNYKIYDALSDKDKKNAWIIEHYERNREKNEQ